MKNAALTRKFLRIRRPIRAFLVFCTLGFASVMGLPCAVCQAGGWGPMQTVNRYAPHLMFLTPVPTAPVGPSADRMQLSGSIDYTSMFVNEQAADWSALIDMEMTSIELSAEYRWNRLGLGMRIPLISMNGGFMDNFLESYHDALGVPNYNRDTRPDNEFAYRLRKNGQDWFSARSGGLHPADATVELLMTLRRSDERHGLDADLQYILKLPLGDADHGFGSGSFDHGFFVPMRLSRSPWYVYMTPGIVLPGKPDTLGSDVGTTLVKCAFLGVEYELDPKISLLVQFNYYTSPLETTGIRQLDVDSLELSLGTVLQMTADTALEVALCEDLTRSAPDFTMHVRLRSRLF